MNLNPLQKDDNTDALVKALEDANATDQTGTTTMGTDDAMIAADPQIAAAGAAPAATDTATSLGATPISVSAPEDDVAATTQAPTAATNLTFDGSGLPTGISGDADAHLPKTTAEGTGDESELDEVKNSALEQLRPLIEKLDLEPADKFDKYLMMLRASDDPALIKPAFDAAQGITGEKEKAQALLDIINEINYITTSSQQQNEDA